MSVQTTGIHQKNARKCGKMCIYEDHCQTIRHLSHMIGRCYGVCQEIVTENLNMHHVAVKFVSLLVTEAATFFTCAWSLGIRITTSHIFLNHQIQHPVTPIPIPLVVQNESEAEGAPIHRG